MAETDNTLGLPDAFRPLVRIYVLRILVKLGGHRYVMDERRVIDLELFQDLGIGLPPPEIPYRPDLLVIKLRSKLKELERRAQKLPVEAVLTENLRWLATHASSTHTTLKVEIPSRCSIAKRGRSSMIPPRLPSQGS